MMMLFAFSTLACLLMAHVASANDEHSAHEHHAHVHGLVQLTIAIENDSLLINLLAPANSFVGFEHKAETKQEIASVKRLQSILNEVSNVITLAPSSCNLSDKTLDIDALLPTRIESKHQAHAEISAEYQLDCQQLAEATSIRIVLFEHFPTIEKIEASWLNNNKQGATNLTRKKNTLFWQ
ncbi:Protein of unknown function DUF2796 [Colwellia psychrerythraea]|uniref:DUF2796 domain-containing protein n=2 Tax=Colwellia psychrerythraea TaxID=28229 RepID=A0A099KJ54_COLPS|nr:Protein of unknown function DUF2796 [Colwellia psychrerythraea]